MTRGLESKTSLKYSEILAGQLQELVLVVVANTQMRTLRTEIEKNEQQLGSGWSILRYTENPIHIAQLE